LSLENPQGGDLLRENEKLKKKLKSVIKERKALSSKLKDFKRKVSQLKREKMLKNLSSLFP